MKKINNENQAIESMVWSWFWIIIGLVVFWVIVGVVIASLFFPMFG